MTRVRVHEMFDAYRTGDGQALAKDTKGYFTSRYFLRVYASTVIFTLVA